MDTGSIFLFLLFATTSFPAFAQASEPVTVPAEDGLIVQGSINGNPSEPLLFDTGSVNLLSAAVAQKLGLHVSTEQQAFDALGGSVQAKVTHVDTLRIGGLTLHDQVFHVLDIPQEAAAPSGVIGYELLQRLAVSVNFEKQQITFSDEPTFIYNGHGTKVPLKIDGQNLEIAASLGGVTGTFLIDTGNEIGLTMNPHFVQANDLVATLGAKYKGYSGKGYGGPIAPAYIVRLPHFFMSGADSPQIIARLSTGTPANGELDGNIGQNVLRQFIVTFDYGRSAMYLEKNANWGHPEVFNRAGLMADSGPRGQTIMTILPGSPADKASLAVGDLIIQIDGHKPSTGPDDAAFLQKPRRLVHITVERAGRTRSVSLRLKNLL